MKKFLKRLLPLMLAAAMMLTLTGCSASDYKKATELMESGDCAAASEIFRTLGDYKDSADLADKCDYQVATDTYAAGDYQQASALFTALGDYEDSAALAVEANDKAIAQKLTGEWISEDVDMTDLMLSMVEGLLGSDEESQKAISYVDFGTISARATLSVAEDGTCTMAADKDSVAEMFSGLTSAMSEGLLKYLDDSFAQAAEEAGVTIDDLYQAYGASNSDELFGLVYGTTFTDYINSIFSEENLEAILENSVEGNCTVENGVIVFVLNDEECASSYDSESDILVIADSDMGDIAFSRVAAA